MYIALLDRPVLVNMYLRQFTLFMSSINRNHLKHTSLILVCLNGNNVQAEVLQSLENEFVKNIPYKGEYLVEGKYKFWIGVSRADGSKCERCWNYSPKVGSFAEHPTLCSRCYDVVAVESVHAAAAVS